MSRAVPRNSPYAPVVQPLHESKEGERSTMQTYTVIACYIEPPQMFTAEVEAEDPAAATAAAWKECVESNWGPDEGFGPREMADEWADCIVIEGAVRLVDNGMAA